jgi:hypothetical protein
MARRAGAADERAKKYPHAARHGGKGALTDVKS